MSIARHSRRRGFIAVITAAALLLAACGDDDDADSSATTTGDATAATEAPDETTAATEAPDETTAATEAPDETADAPESTTADSTAASEAPSEDTTPTGTMPAGEYVIGFEALTSGPAAFAGVPLAQGARLAVKQINDESLLGEGATARLDETDAGGDPARAIGVVEGLIAADASAILCCALSSAAGSVKPLLQQGQTAGIVTSAILPGLNEPPYMYRPVLLLGDPAYAQMIESLNADGEYSTAVVAVTADNDGMVNEGVIWEEAFTENNIEVLDRVDTNTGDTDFSGPATQIIDLNPDIVALSLLGQEATLLAKALRDRGYEGTLVTTYGISNAANYEIGGEALEGIIFPVAFTPQMTHPSAVAFTELYEAEYGEVPDVYAAQGYTSVMMVAEGLRRAGSGDHEAVAQALATIEEMDSPYGTITFTDGQASLEGETTFMVWNADGTQSVWEP